MSNDKNRFAWERSVKASDLPRGTRLVLLVLATDMDNNTRKVATTNRELATDAGMSERSIYTHLKRAEQAGWIERLSRGHHLAPGDSSPSIYVGRFPEPTGSVLPHGDEANRKRASTSTPSQPATTSDQPEVKREPTGSTLPTSHSVHSDHSSSEPEFDDIDLEVHRQIKAKKARGDVIYNERALRGTIRRDLLAEQKLDQALAQKRSDDDGRTEVSCDGLLPAAEALGRNLAGVETTEDGIRDAVKASGLPTMAMPELIDAAINAWRERTNELRRTA